MSVAKDELLGAPDLSMYSYLQKIAQIVHHIGHGIIRCRRCVFYSGLQSTSVELVQSMSVAKDAMLSGSSKQLVLANIHVYGSSE